MTRDVITRSLKRNNKASVLKLLSACKKKIKRDGELKFEICFCNYGLISSANQSVLITLNLKSGSLLNVNLNFVTNIDKVELKSNDSLLVVGKKRDLEHVKHEHLASKLTQLQIPKEVGRLILRLNIIRLEVLIFFV